MTPLQLRKEIMTSCEKEVQYRILPASRHLTHLCSPYGADKGKSQVCITSFIIITPNNSIKKLRMLQAITNASPEQMPLCNYKQYYVTNNYPIRSKHLDVGVWFMICKNAGPRRRAVRYAERLQGEKGQTQAKQNTRSRRRPYTNEALLFSHDI
jgi:hypothetical protein